MKVRYRAGSLLMERLIKVWLDFFFSVLRTEQLTCVSAVADMPKEEEWITFAELLNGAVNEVCIMTKV